MTFSKQTRIGISKQRGFWLRYFLSGGLLPALALSMIPRSADAQIAVLKPLHLRFIQGYVTDKVGKPVSGAEVRLRRDQTVAFETRTDKFGRFRIDGARGLYWLDAWAGMDEGGRNVMIGPNPLTLLRSRTIYIIVMTGRGSCDDCSISVFTSKRSFDKAVRENIGQYD